MRSHRPSRVASAGLAALWCLCVGLSATRAAAGDVLEAKARAFRDALLERHLAAEGFVMAPVDLTLPADAAHQRAQVDTPTFTGLWAASSCDRAGVEAGAAREEALADARRALGGLQFLMDVTGRPGLLARGAQRGPPPDEPGRRWFRGAGRFTAYAWLGDASQDQYANGLLPAVAACRVEFPEQTRALVIAAAGMLLETQMKLVDPDGRRTRYGDLSSSAGWGFNAIGKLTGYAVFALASELDPDPRWSRQRDRLRERERVLETSTRTNLRFLGITGHANDLMAWNLYRALVPVERGERETAALQRGMRRTWERVAPYGNAYFALLRCELEPGPESCGTAAREQIRTVLERFPCDKRLLPPSPELARLPRAWLPGRKWKRRARDPVPLELRPAAALEWSASPYRVSGNALPDQEYSGVDYLMAYWLYRKQS